jgi:hypothetical protein
MPVLRRAIFDEIPPSAVRKRERFVPMSAGSPQISKNASTFTGQAGNGGLKE